MTTGVWVFPAMPTEVQIVQYPSTSHQSPLLTTKGLMKMVITKLVPAFSYRMRIC